MEIKYNENQMTLMVFMESSSTFKLSARVDEIADALNVRSVSMKLRKIYSGIRKVDLIRSFRGERKICGLAHSEESSTRLQHTTPVDTS